MTSLPFRWLFFASDTPEDRTLPVWVKYALPLALFAVTRLLTAGVFELRQVDNVDTAGYIATADYITQHGHIPAEHEQKYRQFPGLSILMTMVNFVVRDMTMSGYVVVALSGAASVVLMQYLFSELRLTLLFVCFFPWWITTTTEILTEGLAVACFLFGYWALRDARPWSAWFVLGLMAAGYGLVVRQTVLFMLLPFVAVFAFRRGRNDPLFATGAVLVTMLPLFAYLTWNWVAIGQLFPQFALQREFIQMLNNQYPGGHYSARLMDWPGRGLLEGLMDPGQPIQKKLMIVACLGLTLLSLGRLILLALRSWNAPEGITAAAFTAGLAVYLGFHLCIGGLSGYRALDRYLAQLVVMINWGLFHRNPLRWPWIVLLTIFFLFYAFFTDIGHHPLGFIK